MQLWGEDKDANPRSMSYFYFHYTSLSWQSTFLIYSDILKCLEINQVYENQMFIIGSFLCVTFNLIVFYYLTFFFLPFDILKLSPHMKKINIGEFLILRGLQIRNSLFLWWRFMTRFMPLPHSQSSLITLTRKA